MLYTSGVFDREAHKEYVIPVVVRDNGYPSLSSTNLVTVVIGDVNDHDMSDGAKHVTLYRIASQYATDTASRLVR